MGIPGESSGSASEDTSDELKAETLQILVGGEKILRAFEILRDVFVFTDRRLILIDRQGLTGKRVEYLSLPYGSITRFSVETTGTFDRDSELKIWISGEHKPIEREFRKGADIISVQQTLAQHVLR